MSTASNCSGASSATQCPLPRTIVLSTFSATSRMVAPTPSPMALLPPMASTGNVSLRFLRCSFCRMEMSIARYAAKLPRSASRLDARRST